MKTVLNGHVKPLCDAWSGQTGGASTRQTDSCKSVLLVEKSAAEKEETDEESVLSQILQNNRVLDVFNGGDMRILPRLIEKSAEIEVDGYYCAVDLSGVSWGKTYEKCIDMLSSFI